ncbi:MAG TPA: hypothetical protein DDW52_03245 [Planctomycetaceae bacterium]|nr:hypothetical protein [Planctomycetaceae bacterium]
MDYETALINVARNADVSTQAVQMVWHCVSVIERRGETCTPAHLCWCVHDIAFHHWGQDAKSHLNTWGIKSTREIGDITFALIDAGLVSPIAQEHREQFNDVFNFENEFQQRHFPYRSLNRWSLSAIFVLTTIVAVASPGWRVNGFRGAIGSLIGAWVVLVGILCAAASMKSEFRGKLLGFTIAAVLIIVGGLVFWTASIREV